MWVIAGEGGDRSKFNLGEGGMSFFVLECAILVQHFLHFLSKG